MTSMDSSGSESEPSEVVNDSVNSTDEGENGVRGDVPCDGASR